MVFDDNHDHSMLAYFSPGGKTCCYYRNGGIHMLSDEVGGTLFDEVCVLRSPVTSIEWFPCHWTVCPMTTLLLSITSIGWGRGQEVGVASFQWQASCLRINSG